MSTKQVNLGTGDSKSPEKEKQKQVRSKQKKDSEELKKTSVVLVLQLLRARTKASWRMWFARTETGRRAGQVAAGLRWRGEKPGSLLAGAEGGEWPAGEIQDTTGQSQVGS